MKRIATAALAVVISATAMKADERDRLSHVTKKLTELGLKQGHW